MPQPPQIQTLLVIQPRGGPVGVWINAPGLLIKVNSKRDISAGQWTSIDDFADVVELKFQGVEIPADAGYVVSFQVGWRRAVVYDFRPLIPPASTLENVPKLLGGVF